jgi:hypothetical protein
LNTIVKRDSLKLTVKAVKCYIRNTASYGAETWILRKIDQKCLESFKGVAGEGRKTLVGSIVLKKKYYTE